MTRTLQIFLFTFIFILSLTNIYKVNAQTPCSGITVNVEDITITSLTSSSIQYNFTIRNTGSNSISTANLLINNALSTDQVVGGDIAAGGSVLGGSTIIAPNGTYSGTHQANNNSSYTYLLVNLEYYVAPTCQVVIDREFEFISVASGLFSSSATETNSIIWDMESKAFTAQSNVMENSFEFQLFNAAGILETSGNASIGETTFINAKEGFYILVVSDGKRSFSKRIIY